MILVKCCANFSAQETLYMIILAQCTILYIYLSQDDVMQSAQNVLFVGACKVYIIWKVVQNK